VTLPNQKELFSVAYVRAVAAAAGFNVGGMDVDDDSVDIEIGAAGPRGSMHSPRLGLQLKCTAAGILADDELPFRLKLKNYDDLRPENRMIPCVLVVMTVPKDTATWLAQSDENLLLCHCAYWLSLRGLPEVEQTYADQKVTVKLSRAKPFTVAALTELMTIVGKGEKP
jgi:hypothetical protein